MKTLKSRKTTRKNVIDIHEEFIPYRTKLLDSKHRITLGGKLTNALGKRMNVDAYMIFIGREGDILLRPTVSISSNEAWAYRNPKVIGNVRKGLEEAREGKTERVDDLDSFLDNL
jgi:hypothetical protein